MFVRKIIYFQLILMWLAGAVLADNFTFSDAKDVSVNINGQTVLWQTEPVYIEKVLYVPLRDILPPLDISIYTNRRTLQTTLLRRSDNLQAVLEEGAASIKIGDRQEQLPREVRLVKNRLYVPMAAFLWKIGYKTLKDQQNRKSYSIIPIINSIVRHQQSLLIESLAPFDYYVNYNNPKRLLTLRMGGYMADLDQYVSQNLTAQLGLVSFNVRYNDALHSGLLLEAEFGPDTRYNLYKYDGRNVMELEIFPPPKLLPASLPEKSESPKPSSPTVNIKSFPQATSVNSISLKKEPPKLLFTTGKFDKPSVNSIWLPSLRDRPSTVFSINGSELILTQPYFYQDGVLMVPLKLFFEKAGYNIHINTAKKQAAITRDDGIDYLVTAGRPEMVDRTAVKTKATIMMDKPPRVQGEDICVPLFSFARIIGMGVRWDAKLQKVFINHRIYEVVYEDNQGLRQLTLKCTGEITLDKVLQTLSPSVLYVTIPNTNLDVESPVVEVNDDKLKSYRLVQLTNNDCRLAIDTKGEVPYGILANDNILEGTIQFPSGITGVELKSNKSITEMLIRATGAVTPNIQKLDDPYRLVLDVPNTVLKSPQFYEGDAKLIHRVRASQFQWNPLVTRIVVELEKNAFYTVQKSKDDKQINVLFSLKDVKEKVKEDLKVVVPKKERKALPIFKDLLVVVEAGHGGNDPGCIGVSGTYEKGLTLATAKLLQEELEDRGAKVIMPRETDTYMSLADRVAFANQNNADLFISVHYNSFINDMLSGTETFFTKPMDYGLAVSVHRRMVDELHRNDKGVRKAMLYVLHYTRMPAICVEPLFLSNKWDEMLAKDSQIQHKIALAITDGIEDYLKKNKKVEKKASQP